MSEQLDTYCTIRKPSSGVYKEKGSKFLSFAFPVKTENEIKEKINELKSNYYDARHHCFAFRLGADKLIYRTNDDGEPSGTAGKPILGQIVSHDLTNILVVVVRYFGGTLLGTGGLINAYRTASAEAIGHAEIIREYVMVISELHFYYPQMNQIMKIIKDYELEILDQKFELDCYVRLSIKLSIVETVLSKFSSIEGTDIHPTGKTE